MDWTNGVDPNILYMSSGETIAYLGIDRNQLRGLMVKKILAYDRIAGHTMLYRSSVEAYKQKRDNAGKVHNPYAKEAQHAAV